MIEIQFSSRAKLAGHRVGNTDFDVGEYGMEADVETLAAHPSISTVIIIRHIRRGWGAVEPTLGTRTRLGMIWKCQQNSAEIYRVYQYQNST